MSDAARTRARRLAEPTGKLSQFLVKVRAAIHVITGPSRTADIELTLTRRVHGRGDVPAIFVDTPWHG